MRPEVPLALMLILAGALSGCLEAETQQQGTTTWQATTTASEPTSTTSAALAVTTSSTTSTSSTTTTAAPYTVACKTNGDCGEPVDERICNQGSVYINRVMPTCQSPGTPYAKCAQKQTRSESPAEVCATNRMCVEGVCVLRD